MSRIGVLGDIEPYTSDRHELLLRLGKLFGTYESWLQNNNAEEELVASNCQGLIELMNNEFGDLVRFDYCIKPYSGRRKGIQQAGKHLTRINNYLRHREPSEGVYFLIGTALGMLMYGSEPTVRNAQNRLETHGKVLYGKIFNAKALFDQIKSIAVPRNGRSDDEIFNTFERELQKLKQPIVILILDLTATVNMDLESEQGAIKAALENYTQKKQCTIRVRPAYSLEGIQSDLDEYRPHIVHFAGHGGSNGLLLRVKNTNSQWVQIAHLADLFKQAKEHQNLQVVCLNACLTTDQSDTLKKFIDVISMGGKILNEDAIIFARAFYTAIGAGKTILAAFNAAQEWLKVVGRFERTQPTYHQVGQGGKVKIPEDPVADSKKAQHELHSMTEGLMPQVRSSMANQSEPMEMADRSGTAELATLGMPRAQSVPVQTRVPQQPLHGNNDQNIITLVNCDRCLEQFGEEGGYNCRICSGGEFDVCRACVRKGIGCFYKRHRLFASNMERL